jgi:hypothetical protein
MGRLKKYTNIIYKSDFRSSIPVEQFDRVERAMKDHQEFVTVSDVFDGSPIMIRVSEIEAASIWTEEGQAAWARHQQEVKEINEAHEKPDWS